MFLQYQMNTDQLSETLTKLNNNLDPKSLNAKSNPEVLLQLKVLKSIVIIRAVVLQAHAPCRGRG